MCHRYMSIHNIFYQIELLYCFICREKITPQKVVEEKEVESHTKAFAIKLIIT